MSEKRYPTRMHEVLGVEPEELFEIPNLAGEVHVDNYGYLCSAFENDVVCGARVCEAINHGITRRPRLTQEQEYVLKALYVAFDFKWLAKQQNGAVMAYENKPNKDEKAFGGESGLWYHGGGEEESDYGWMVKTNSPICSLVSWSDPEPLDIVQTLRQNGVEVEG